MKNTEEPSCSARLSAEYTEQFHSFDSLPTAMAMFRIVTDRDGHPSDFVPIYVNKACQQLFQPSFPLPIGQSFYQIHPDASRQILKYCSRTALEGKPHKSEYYIPKLRKYLQFSCYQPFPGICGCVIQNLTRQRQMERRAISSQRKLNVIMQHSIDYLFDLNLQTMMLTDASRMLGHQSLLPQIGSLPQGLVQKGLINEGSVPAILSIIEKVRQGACVASCNIEFRLDPLIAFQWYTMSLYAWQMKGSTVLSAIGYLKNIHSIVVRQKQLELLANRDSLTRIHNLRAGRTLVERRLATAPAPRQNTMFLFDMDNFKNINDLYGHYTGDEVLQKFATLLKSVFRRTDIVYRMGGDEFIAFAPDAGDDYFPHRICHDILDMTTHLPGIEFPISVSIGVAVGSSPEAGYDDYYRQADKALYAIKKQDKSAYAFSYF